VSRFFLGKRTKGASSRVLVNKKTTRFTIDTLIEMMCRIGKPVTLAVG
jgi:predicted XRE-type DNA-binding protein